jgi:DNA mismatch repair ATPase MutS
VVGEPAYGLALLSEVLARFEQERFASPRLVALRKELEADGLPPSRRIARLNRLMELLDSSDHVLVRAIGGPLLYVPQLVFAIEAWRKKSGPHVRKWLAATGEIEVLCAFANYAYEHPGDPFPEFAEDGPCYEGEALAHPLLAEGRAVRNDVRLGGELRVMVVSGSNMSGKSTLLRTVGINAVLAMAGAPVRARRLRLSPLAVGASIRTLDSLQGGTSRFYTEITRLRRLVELTKGPVPLLFLLDELLQGTNSHDRRIGAEAFVHGLIERGAVGLLTTHDLALAAIADTLAPRARNVHFEDHLENGKMTFDYKLRPGVVRKSNALELMRSVGLEV